MFSAQDILEIAIRLEKNGERTYLEAARQTNDETLRGLLTWMAGEERAHARWFSELKARLDKGEDHHLLGQLSQALVEDVVKGQAFSLQEVDFAAIDTPGKMIHTFIGFEDDTISFYQLLTGMIEDASIAAQLNQIIAEEKAHIQRFTELLPAAQDPMTENR